MAVIYKKLIGYDPFWIYHNDIVPESHIEDILLQVSFNNKRAIKKLKRLTKEMAEEEHWTDEDMVNIDREDIWHLTASGELDKIPNYIKCEIDNTTYYYYLVNKTEKTKAIAKNGNGLYDAVYDLDEYMTIYWNKLNILKQFNPSVYANTGFDSRWDKRIVSVNGKNSEKYVVDFVNQRWLGNTLTTRNCLKVRELIFSTTPTNIFSLNFGNLVIPASYEINRFDTGANPITITSFNTKLNTPNSRGRFNYIVAKSSAKVESSNSKLVPSNTDQQTIIIPLFADSEAEILHGLNDFDITKTGTGILAPFGDNEMGIFECDIPFNIFYGFIATGKYGAKMEYAHQPMANSKFIDVAFFTIDNNAPMLINLMDYTEYEKGMYGKFRHFVENIGEWTPETEPAMWNPAFYQEVYNNGESEIAIDTAKLIFEWDSEDIVRLNLQAYLSWSSDLTLAYNFGEYTNSQLATYDNTETTLGKASIKNLYIGSNSSSYYTTNSATIATSLQNRQSEETQAWVDASLQTAEIWAKAAPSNIFQAMSPLRNAKAAAKAAIQTAQIMTNTAMEQDRANKTFKSSVNNITTSPSPTLSDPSIKGVIPNRHGLLEHYAKKLHPSDERVIFTQYTTNGYPLDDMYLLNDLLTNRTYMNILNCDTTLYSRDELMSILSENDNTPFNTKFWNERFLAWMNSNIKIYNSIRLINCTDYYGPNYISNIERELPPSPVVKDNINRYIKNFRDHYIQDEQIILKALKEDNPVPEGHEDIWDSIDIKSLGLSGFIINSDPDSKYYGDIVVNATCYLGYVEDDDGTKHYFDDISILCNASFTWNIVMPDGTEYSSSTFNSKIILEKFENIPNYFLNNCTSFNQPLTLPDNLISIAALFLYNCKSFNQPLTLPDSLTTIGNQFLYYCQSFNQPLTLPDSLTTIGTQFLGQSRDMISTINIQNLSPEIFEKDNATLAVTDASSPSYITGITIEGTNKDAFLERFPNSMYQPYFRKLK